MSPFSGLGIGLSLVFGCFVFALVAELSYLLWWKKRTVSREAEEEEQRNRTKQLLYLLCWRRPSSVHNNSSRSSSRDGHGGATAGNVREDHDPELGSGKDLLLKTFGEEGIESELMRLHNLAGPPRFLFTIKEETKEDLETDSVKSRHRSLGDLIMAVDSPFLTPLASPMKSSPLGSYHHHGINPLFESSVSETELAKLLSSPPPKFKFLRDAEAKLCRKLKEEEAEKRVSKNGGFEDCGDRDRDGSFVAIVVGKSNHSSSSQVLPLPSSPSKLRPLDQKSSAVH